MRTKSTYMATSKTSKPETIIDPASIGVDRTLVLIGLMGAGKTTVGRRLAKALGLDFMDSDHEIEVAADMSVSEIFESFGEEEFRAVERRVIARLLDGSPKVIATGGGAFINRKTRDLIHEKGLSIWLDADLDVLVERTARRETRPLLLQGDPHEILGHLLRERSPYYSEAKLRIKSCAGPHDRVVEDVITALEVYHRQSKAAND